MDLEKKIVRNSNEAAAKRKKPWKREAGGEGGRRLPLDVFEEESLVALMRPHLHNELVPPKVRRAYRKLCVRGVKESSSYARGGRGLLGSHYFLEYGNGKTSLDDANESLAGIVKRKPYLPVHCQYTGRTLKPVIWVGHYQTPPWIRLLEELTDRARERSPRSGVGPYARSELRFEYVQPHYVPALNALANAYFWPSIDLSSALEYKEFSCVALYKSVVVGFGLMTPGSHLNEGYINFLFVRPHWRNCGIASFMLYHLFNTAYIWDNTLHVSASNPSALLYQKFGFKPHRVYSKFYDKYLPTCSSESRNAIFLKLEA